ncbi:MAG: MBL fold metallo-hydrolase [Candidatus Hydrothermae bacterium]|nr:MBL fold metallo-hydrolase [Candidatus Hydrothermae bacterium]
MRVTIVFNNVIGREDLGYGWGMAAYVEGYEKKILFDTGDNGTILLKNLQKLGIKPEDIDFVFLSHAHEDHTGGLWSFLREKSDVTVCLLRSFPASFKARIKEMGATVLEVDEPVELLPGVWTTGPLGETIEEQSLILRTQEGILILTGCSHPGITNIVKKARELFPEDRLLFVTGGFHLLSTPRGIVRRIAEELKQLGVEKIGPSHCTGEEAREIFREVFGENFVEAGAGTVFSF